MENFWPRFEAKCAVSEYGWLPLQTNKNCFYIFSVLYSSAHCMQSLCLYVYFAYSDRLYRVRLDELRISFLNF